MKANKEESPKYVKYIVRVAVSNKPIYVTSSLTLAQTFCSKHSKKKLWIDSKILE